MLSESILARNGGKLACMRGGTFGERLQAALTHTGKTRAQLAAVLRDPAGNVGISASAVGQVIRGDTNQFTAENAVRAARYLGVDAYWLCTGDGAMRPPPSANDTAPVYRAVTDDEAIARLGALLRQAPPAHRTALADVLAAWARDPDSDERGAAVLSLFRPPT